MLAVIKPAAVHEIARKVQQDLPGNKFHDYLAL